METRNSWPASTRMPFELMVTAAPFPQIISRLFCRLLSRRLEFRRSPRFDVRISIFGLLFFLAGCGAPGDPVAPSPPIPTAITDLSGHQAGDAVQLTFTMPKKTVRGERLAASPAIEILRGAAKADGSPDAKSFRVVDTIPGALVAKYQADDHVQFLSPVAPSETHPPGVILVYRVRTRAAKKRSSAESNPVTVRVFPVPEKIASVQSKVSETSIDLSWPAPARTSGGDALAVSEYHVYRGQLDPRSHDPAGSDVLHEKWIAPLVLLARSDAPGYRDTQFEFGKLYVYVVRSVATAAGNALESSDSDPLLVTPVDTFPPAMPQGLVAAVLVNPTAPSPEVDLSWSINAEPDLAGYRVYRSEQENANGRLVTPDLLLSPAYRDTTVAAGQQYWYRVTAVDRSGNESAPTPPVAADVAQHSP